MSPRFQDPVDTDPSSWTESLYAGPSPWSLYDSYTPVHDSSNGGNNAVQATGIEAEITSQMQTFDSKDVHANDISYMPPTENPADLSTFEFNELEMPCSGEDPFMGWGSKRASHNFDDYGWVLSHVENL